MSNGLPEAIADRVDTFTPPALAIRDLLSPATTALGTGGYRTAHAWTANSHL
jgi:hypothetical protein